MLKSLCLIIILLDVDCAMLCNGWYVIIYHLIMIMSYICHFYHIASTCKRLLKTTIYIISGKVSGETQFASQNNGYTCVYWGCNYWVALSNIMKYINHINHWYFFMLKKTCSKRLLEQSISARKLLEIAANRNNIWGVFCINSILCVCPREWLCVTLYSVVDYATQSINTSFQQKLISVGLPDLLLNGHSPTAHIPVVH